MPRKNSVTVSERAMVRFSKTHIYYLELTWRASDEYGGKCGRKFVRKMNSKSQKKTRK